MNRQPIQLPPLAMTPKAADTTPTTGDTVPTSAEDSTTSFTLEECGRQLHTLVLSEGAMQYAIGVIYNHILDNRLTEKAGYQRASVYFAHEFKDIAQSTLSLYGTVASTFTEDEAKKYTVSKLGKLITYFNTTKQSLPGEDPGTILLKVPEKSGAVVEKRFADCTRSDLNKAIKLLEGTPHQMPATDSQSVGLFHDALRLGVGHESTVELKAIYTERDGTIVNLTNVKLSELHEVAALLAAVPPPPGTPMPGSPTLGRPLRMRSLPLVRH